MPTLQHPTPDQRQDRLVVTGASEHNLKNVDLELPRNQLVVFTGVSGSGKSSLAFDTLYAEGPKAISGDPECLCPTIPWRPETPQSRKHHRFKSGGGH